MIVLHCVWNETDGQMALWGESSSREAGVTGGTGDRPGPGPRPHPFAAAQDELRDALAESLMIRRSRPWGDDARAKAITLYLPSSLDAPYPSPETSGDRVAAPGKAVSLPWDTECLVLGAGHALGFLLMAPLAHKRGDLVLGASTRFWSQAARFLMGTIARGHFAPGIRQSQGKGGIEVHSSWQLALDRRDSERLGELSRAMPKSSLAAGNSGPSSDAPAALVRFLETALGEFLRETVGPHLPPGVIPRRRQSRSLPNQWVASLIAEDAKLVGSGEAATRFAETIGGWNAVLRPTEARFTFKPCFRLETPDTARDGAEALWLLSYHLKAEEDPSLLLSAKDAREPARLGGFFRGLDPAQALLCGLSEAGRVFPPIATGLGENLFDGVHLDTTQAYSFLREAAPVLKEMGYVVLVPPWWDQPSSRVKARLKMAAVEEGSGLFRARSLVRYSWEVAVGDQTMPADEFLGLVRLKAPLLKVRGRWVEFQPEQADRLIEFLEREGRREVPLAEALKTGLSGELRGPASPAVPFEIEPAGTFKEILGNLSGTIQLPLRSTPEGFNGTLRPYQVGGFSWLRYLADLGLGACLADDMGLGKTVEFLAFLLDRLQDRDREQAKPSLLVCPMSVVGNWEREALRFAPGLKVMVHHGASRPSAEEFARSVQGQDLVITTYGLANRDEDALTGVDWDCVALDEAQNIKNPEAKQTRSVKRLRAAAKVVLTGTPVENRLSELWSILDFLNPGYLGSFDGFRQEFAIPIERHKDDAKVEALQRRIRPLVLRRVKTDPKVIQDLPSKMEMKVYCNLTVEQASLYQAVVDEMIGKIRESSGMKRRGLVLSALTKLKQVCNHPAHFLKDRSRLGDRSGKLNRLSEMLDEVLAEGDSALVFTQFAAMGSLLQEYLAQSLGIDIPYLHGGTPKAARDRMVDEFQNNRDGPRVFVLSLKAGGFGLNLTRANHVFHFDRWWNPAVESQATDRSFRIGQDRNVQVRKMISIGTLEERIDQLMEQKKHLAESIIKAGEIWLTELSTEELKGILALGHEAIGEE